MAARHDTGTLRRAALIAGVGLMLAAALPPAARATPVTIGNAQVTFSPTSLPATTGGINGIDLTGDVGKKSFTLNTGSNQVSVTLSGGANPGASVVQGAVGGEYAEPVTGGTLTNPTYWTAPYFSTGGAYGNQTGGSITMTFASAQMYLGFLWGSIGTGDEIDFYSGSTDVASITGAEVIASTSVNTDGGAQGYGGSQYTFVNLISGTYNKVVLTQTGQPSFESADYQYAKFTVKPLPEPASLAVFGVGLAALGMLRRRKRANPTPDA